MTAAVCDWARDGTGKRVAHRRSCRARPPPRWEGLGPGGQQAQQAALPAEVGGISGASLPSGSGKVQAEVVQALWARAGERLPCLGQRQGAEKRGPGQKPRPLRVKPPGGGVVLARGTVARRAGRRAVREGLARCARGDRPAQGFGTTRCHGLHGCQGTWGHPGAAEGAGGGAVTPAEGSQLDHDRPRERLRGRAYAP